ncbi:MULTISPECIES: T9SS type A sorting domain-containing protein [Reichenbachiella]|uniref:Por secretion system C-terminal sorting domain-containing protein n=1 Tax=Reichenbachiella agariperforans TaxID=156994 RepID=A0A1M6N2C4_REIAG|nr:MULTISPECIES: T9SS type A sorting domain-containing protein [Reichenbachiella]MBU2915693.1 T9SS type A sorting domain-containing protein [Reichenbachiella agariperforans]RJE72038.1 hypothetical protein BGP76_08145 [Reichenbachiella sp. MSK19-1]SHJ89841.1 Por secretion system C-terminal sorting domain-containing protein [Reichenbachiella agariperforans]
MKQFKFYIAVMCLVALGSVTLKAQEAVSSSGGDGLSPDGAVSFTIGQMAYTNYSGQDGAVSAGVQQTYEITVVTGIEREEIQLDLVAYPNPTTDFLHLKIDGGNSGELSYQLYNLQGQIVSKNQLNNDRAVIDMKDLPRSAYFLKVLGDRQVLKTFKIIKN